MARNMRERWLSVGSRVASGVLVAGIVAGVGISRDTGSGSDDWIAIVIAGVALGGFVAGSLLAIPLLPAAVFAAGALVNATDCPDCHGGGEEALTWVGKLFVLMVVAVVLAIIGGLGVLAAKLLAMFVREREEPLVSLTPPLLVAVPVVLAIFAGAVLAVRYQSNRDTNGPVLASSGPVNYRPGPKWDGKPDDANPSSIGQLELDNFSEYTLWWFGPAFDGYNLQAALHHPGRLDAVNSPGADSVHLVYGFCGPAPCTSPVQLTITPVCAVKPPIGVAQPPQTLAGGAVMQLFQDAGHAMVWTGDSAINVFLLAGRERLDEALAALRPVRSERPASLPPPDFSACPGL